ncbi:MAG: hypothetical protein QXU53_07090 [Thermosphaera sp.]
MGRVGRSETRIKAHALNPWARCKGVRIGGHHHEMLNAWKKDFFEELSPEPDR